MFLFHSIRVSLIFGGWRKEQQQKEQATATNNWFIDSALQEAFCWVNFLLKQLQNVSIINGCKVSPHQLFISPGEYILVSTTSQTAKNELVCVENVRATNHKVHVEE